jgi:SEC-C motif-containing protein
VSTRCPCGRPAAYDECCGPFHAGMPAPTAERLMRSRYTAFVRVDADYLHRTWHPSTRPRAIRFDPRQVWTGLRVVDTSGGGLFDQAGTVSFVASGNPTTVREDSQFVRSDGFWVYLGPRADKASA